MRVLIVALIAILVSFACLAQETAAAAGEPVKMPTPTWYGTGCKGEELSVLMGCPFDSGSPFVMRVRIEKGLQIPSHAYPIDIGVTLLEGLLEITFTDGGKKRTVTMRPGDFFKVPAYAYHTARAIEKVTVQDNGIGPVYTMWEREKCAPGPKPDPLQALCARGN